MCPFYYDKEKKASESFSYYLNSDESIQSNDAEPLVFKLNDIVNEALKENHEVIFLCIGTDRNIGDSLGPLVGTMLKESQIPFRVYGTLQEPIHAFNLKATLKEIKKQFKKPFIISIDASLGYKEEVGYVIFKEGALTPGAALQKMLPEVGDYHFIGVINYIDSLPSSQFLNDTRLYTVMNLAKIIKSVISEIKVTNNIIEYKER